MRKHRVHNSFPQDAKLWDSGPLFKVRNSKVQGSKVQGRQLGTCQSAIRD